MSSSPPVNDADDALNAHYGDHALCERILRALADAGRDPERLSRDDLAGFDEFHGGGRASTRALARDAGAEPGMRVLDVGCGVGGPARTLAAEFGCTVTGVDITESFVRAARMLSERTGLTDRVSFRVAGATGLPFESGSFDLVWSQNVIMNVADKAACFAEMTRVLAPGGRVALELNVRQEGSDPLYPTFWADDPSLSHLVTREALTGLLEAAGLTIHAVTDLTERAVAVSEKRLAATRGADPDPLGMQVLVTRHLAQKFRNGLANYREGRTRALQVIADRDRPGGADGG